MLGGKGPIIPILIGDSRRAVEVVARLLEDRVYALSIRPPTVPHGTARLRTTIMATHELTDLDFAARAIAAGDGIRDGQRLRATYRMSS